MAKIIYGETEIEIPDEPNKATICDMSIEAYHDLGSISKYGKNAVLSKSQLVDLECPAIFKYKHIDGGAKVEKDYFNVGNAVHTLALEPKTFHDRFYIIPEGMRRDKRTEAFKSCMAEAGVRKMVTAADFEDVKGMAKAVTQSKKAMTLLEGTGYVEQSVLWKDTETGLNLRCRPDLRREDGLIIDLKTAATAEPRKFFRTAFDCHYDISSAMTCEGIEAATGKRPDNYVFLVIEKTAPYIIEAYDSFRPFDPDDMSRLTYLDAGKFRYRNLLNKFIECRNNNDWHGYSKTIDPMTVPYYEIKNLEKNGE